MPRRLPEGRRRHPRRRPVADRGGLHGRADARRDQRARAARGVPDPARLHLAPEQGVPQPDRLRQRAPDAPRRLLGSVGVPGAGPAPRRNDASGRGGAAPADAGTAKRGSPRSRALTARVVPSIRRTGTADEGGCPAGEGPHHCRLSGAAPRSPPHPPPNTLFGWPSRRRRRSFPCRCCRRCRRRRRPPPHRGGRWLLLPLQAEEAAPLSGPPRQAEASHDLPVTCPARAPQASGLDTGSTSPRRMLDEWKRFLRLLLPAGFLLHQLRGVGASGAPAAGHAPASSVRRSVSSRPRGVHRYRCLPRTWPVRPSSCRLAAGLISAHLGPSLGSSPPVWSCRLCP